MEPQTHAPSPPVASGLTVEIVDSGDRFAGLEADWDVLLAAYPGRNPFLTYQWAATWLQTLGRDVRLFVLVAREGSRVRGIAPFCIQPGRLLTFIGYPQNDYADLIVDEGCPQAIDAIVDTLYQHRRLWKRGVLDQIPESRSQWGALAAKLRAAGRPYLLDEGAACPAMTLQDAAAAKKQYYKKNIANYVNWFRARGELTFELYEDAEVTLQRLEPLFAQHIGRWNGTASPSAFLREPMKEFHRGLVRAMHPRGWLKLAALRLGEEYLGFYLFFEYERVMCLYRPTFNIEYAKHSPGQVILRYLLDYALERGVHELDFTRGDEGYKGRFANVTRQSRRIVLYENALAKGWASSIHRLRRSRVVVQALRIGRARELRQGLLQWYHNRNGAGR